MIGDGAAGIDPAFQPLFGTFAGDGDVSVGKMFASVGLRANGKFFASAKAGNMILKLPKGRVAELIAAGHGEPFTRGEGGAIIVKEWVTVLPGKTDWVALAQEARRFASTS